MLQTQTIAPATLQLLKRFMQDSELRSFRLVGGTSLALQLGHRISVDLDLFTDAAFDEQLLREYNHRRLPTRFRTEQASHSAKRQAQRASYDKHVHRDLTQKSLFSRKNLYVSNICCNFATQNV